MASSQHASSVEILLTVSKEFLNGESKTLEITLVRHVEHDCLEIIGYDKSIAQETNRIYVSLRKVRSKLNRKVVEEETSKIESELIAPKTQEEKVYKALTDLTVDFLLCRIKYQPNSLQPNYVLYMTSAADSTEETDTLLLPAFQYDKRPDGIIPYRIVRNKALSEGLSTLDILLPVSPVARVLSSSTKVSPANRYSPSYNRGSARSSRSPVNEEQPASHPHSHLLANDHSNLLRMDVWTSALPTDEEEEKTATEAAATAAAAAAAAKRDRKHSSLSRRSFEAVSQLAQRVLPTQLVPLMLGTRSNDYTTEEEQGESKYTTPVKGSLPHLAPRTTSTEKGEAPKRRNTYSITSSMSLARMEPQQLLHLPRTHRLAGSSVKADGTTPNGRNRRTIDDDLAVQHNIRHPPLAENNNSSSGGGSNGNMGMDSARRPEGGQTEVMQTEGTRSKHHKTKKLSYHNIQNFYS